MMQSPATHATKSVPSDSATPLPCLEVQVLYNIFREISRVAFAAVTADFSAILPLNARHDLKSRILRPVSDERDDHEHQKPQRNGDQRRLREWNDRAGGIEAINVAINLRAGQDPGEGRKHSDGDGDGDPLFG